MRQGCIVEVGSYLGKSTTCLGKGLLANAYLEGEKKVYAIDPHKGLNKSGSTDTYKLFQQNIDRVGLREIVIPLVMTSMEAVPLVLDPIGLLFVDGCHDEDFVASDLNVWSVKLLPGGTIAVHDCSPKSSWTGPRNAFRKYVIENDSFEFLGFTQTTGVAIKKF